jgi:glycosyltransferase involved in cell wall biosynthesis/SAM-dependent methyltransferase
MDAESLDLTRAKPEAASGSALVSIIITTYNHTRFLRDAIESAVAQAGATFEVIVVDDGSTDDPASVVSRYHEVRLIRQRNQGLAAARNIGWRAARGHYIVFLDADDRLLPEALASNLRHFVERPECAFVYGGYCTIDNAGRLLNSPPLEGVAKDAYASFLRANCVGMHATVMYRRDRLQEVGGFDARLSACEDYELYLRLARRYQAFAGMERIAAYRQHDSNMSRNIPLMLHSVLEVLHRQRPYLGGNPEWKKAFKAGLRNWKSFYAANQLQLARDLARSTGLRQVPLRSVVKVFSLAPVSVLRTACTAMLKMLRSRAGQIRGRSIRLGDLRRIKPVSANFGYDRGKPIDRRYIEDFLSHQAENIRGRVLEAGDNTYTMRFGGSRVTHSDILHINRGNPRATLVGDLADGDHLPSEAFDCIVLTQTLHLVFDIRKAVATLHRMLKPGGILLATVPGVSCIDRGEWGPTWYWSLSPAALHRLLQEKFGPANVNVSAYGNVLAAAAFLYGLAEGELRPSELDAHDPRYPLVVAARAVRL